MARTGFGVPIISVIHTSGTVAVNKPWFEKTSVSVGMYCTDLIPLGGWVAADRDQPVLETWIRSQWEPGGALFLPKFPQDGALVLCRDSTPKFGPNLFHSSLDLVDRFDILCGVGGDDVSWLCVPPGLFYRDLLQ